MTEPIYSPELTRRRAIAGLFPDRASAEEAVEELKAAGFTGDQKSRRFRHATHLGAGAGLGVRVPPRWGATATETGRQPRRDYREVA
jgi:hypothetical protein